MLLRSGLSDLKILEPICWSMLLREYSSWMKLEIHVKMLSNGLLRKVLCVRKIWEVLGSILLILLYILMLSIEEVVRSSRLLEDAIMLVNYQLLHHCKNLFSHVKLQHQWMLWEVCTIVWTREEELSMKKNRSQELQLI